MGFVLSVLYFLTYYLTPTVLFGPLAQFRVELLLAVLLLLVSVPALGGSVIFKTTQSLGLIGLAVATAMSVIVGAHWVGGGLTAFLLFIPNAYAYFLVCIYCKSRTRIKVVVLMVLFVCLFVIAQGAYELHQGLPTGPNVGSIDMSETYFLGMNNDAGEWFFRLRGKGEINDPNDFAQVIVTVLPLTFIFWRQKKRIRNFFFVVLPVCALLWGAYLTHSRGAILGLLAVTIMAARRKIGTVPALVIAGVLFFAASALHFTGGREISTNAGGDRTALWGEGLQIFKSHPLFGVGFGYMPEYATQTAHNTIVVCAAELGFFGLYFWSLFLLPSIRDARALASPRQVGEPVVPITPPASPLSPFAPKLEMLDKAEINRLGRLLVLAFTGFLVTGWFLSRAYVLTLFLLGGLTEVVYEMALERGMIAPRLSFGRSLGYSGLMAIGLILLMYITLRIVNLTH